MLKPKYQQLAIKSPRASTSFFKHHDGRGKKTFTFEPTVENHISQKYIKFIFCGFVIRKYKNVFPKNTFLWSL
jgi:hypothetical protein